MRPLLTAIPETAPGRVHGQHVQSPGLTLLLGMFLILQGLHYSSSESALRECHLICAAGRTVLQIRWKMMQILINHADKTINIPTACSTYYLSLLTEPQLICSAPWLEAQPWDPAPPQHQQHKHWIPGLWARKLYFFFPPHNSCSTPFTEDKWPSEQSGTVTRATTGPQESDRDIITCRVQGTPWKPFDV